MQVRMAEHYGMCFGVRDAVDLALGLTREGPLTILGDLVHNPDVVARMDAAGAVRVPLGGAVRTPAVLLTAHGTSDRVKLELRQQGLQVHDATCPLVTRAHLALRRLVAEGRHPIVIGQAKHIEVRGLVGDLDDCTVVTDESDLSQLDERLRRDPTARLGIVAQTTQPLERVMELVEALRARFRDADVRFIDTVCQPTKDRQQALRDLAAETDVVIVVGGPDSNNSRKLVELARSLGRAAHLVANASELRPQWFDGCDVVGVTAGTSTPEGVVEGVRAWLERLPAAAAASVC
ncbi:MAG TPA: 4-hydroxy-3-methylbut-2-enyl diphosphate reductase [Gemmataceae bacterium]|nr:4-hydroxy-3-methylbut-2-enyl diphosphate reductase [Gemmataceae bacterium]